MAASLHSRRRSGALAQIGSVNLFNDPPHLAPYHGWLGEYFGTMQWRPGMDILRDMRTAALPEENSYEFFKNISANRYGDIENNHGECKIA